MLRKTLMILLLPLLQLACNNATKTKSETLADKPLIENDGVKIAYDDTKTGDTTLVFIHGWGINRTYWTNQLAFFEKNYRVVTVDLPGFGESGKNRKDWTVENYAKDVSAVINTLQLQHVVLIGHSMSGAIVLEAALNNPKTVTGIIGIDNFNSYGWVETPESKKETKAFFDMARVNYTKVVSGYANQALFSASTDSLIRVRVITDIISSDSVIAVNSLEQNMHYPIDTKLKTYSKTLALVNSSANPTDTAAFRKNGIKVSLFDVGKTGHYPMVENPSLFNRLLQQAISNATR